VKYTVIYHTDVKDTDLPKISKTMKRRIKKAIEERLMSEPDKYGKPLRKTLKGYWKLRVGNYRIVYKIKGRNVIVLGIIHRKAVYPEINKRV
jgi:mRNA interferase RelE/StbE